MSLARRKPPSDGRGDYYHSPLVNGEKFVYSTNSECFKKLPPSVYLGLDTGKQSGVEGLLPIT